MTTSPWIVMKRRFADLHLTESALSPESLKPWDWWINKEISLAHGSRVWEVQEHGANIWWRPSCYIIHGRKQKVRACKGVRHTFITASSVHHDCVTLINRWGQSCHNAVNLLLGSTSQQCCIGDMISSSGVKTQVITRSESDTAMVWDLSPCWY